MTGRHSAWVGADPGGLGNFGIALLTQNAIPLTRCVDCADEAVAFVKSNVGVEISGVGVDAPLWWSSGRSSDRLADQWLRKRYGLSAGEVQPANSLRGAALVQATMFVLRLREAVPAVRVTEVHPKALLKILGCDGIQTLLGRSDVPDTWRSEHERDAVIAAVAAREGFEGRWTHDLSLVRSPSEQDPSTSWVGPIRYFWPEA
jgi:predicted nuclease with RNAse H fold